MMRQADKMSEKDTKAELHNRSLGQDIREFGDLLGEVIRRYRSDEAFEVVESLRQSAISYREGDDDARGAMRDRIQGLDPGDKQTVARAFTTYFELTNLSEERDRVRTIRAGSQDGTLQGTLEEAIEEVSEMEPDVAQQILDDVLVQPTFTAHPTEARRMVIKSKLRSLARELETLDEQTLTDKERDQIKRDIRAEVIGLWKTPQIRERRPEPEDEASNIRWYLANSIFEIVPEVYDELETAAETGLETDIDVPQVFEFRSWAGSDRDGNPYVTPDVTDTTLAQQRSVVIERYIEILDELSGALSEDGDRITVDEDLFGSVPEELEEIRDSAADRYPNEPYRQMIVLMRERLDRVEDIRPGGYDSADEFHDDLAALATNLRANDCHEVAESYVEKAMRQVQTFGFTLASLDLRDHQQNHTSTLEEVLAREGIEYGEMSESERVEFLTEAILQDEPLIDLADREGLSDLAARVLERFEEFANWQQEYGQDAIDTYCISMAEEPSHVLEVLFLSDQAGVVDLPEHCGVDIVPLLETERALSGARRIMGTLFENEAYGQALAQRDNSQEILLGYSDSNKENGFLAASWSLYKNQRRLARIVDDYDVDLRLFHGRGDSISRGWGPLDEALRALPNSTITGEVKFTVQGEAIAENYRNQRIGERELEQMLNAQVSARKEAIEQPVEETPDGWLEAMDTMSDAAREAYISLLNSEGFVDYFRQATPIEVIEDLNLGSRPASRSEDHSVEDLRSIPWVFSWTQSRCILPGWYSVATGIDAYLDEGGDIETLEEMYQQWPFFRTTIDNAAMALGRTDWDVARTYAQLAEPELRDEFFPHLENEYKRAVDLVTTVADREHPVEQEWLRESLDRRSPYGDPLHVLQTQLLAKDDRTPEEERTLRLTVKGIAAGIKNTG